LPVRCAGKSAEVAVDQIRTISSLRLVKRIDALSTEKAARLRELIVEMYGLP
jgi:mRNA interferase MazF